MGYIAAAVDVACDYAGAAAHVLDAMQQRWAELRLRKDSAAAAVLQAMSTMPATDTAFLREATGRSARAVRRAVRQLADSGALAESVDDVTGRAVFELPEMLQVVDGRVRLVSACWEMRAAGAEPQDRALIERWRDSVARHAAPRELPRCAHIGARSKTWCKRRSGHNPPHRYT